jgi:hypothetical protein
VSSRLGIYDIFSRIVPGGLYLGALVEFARILNLIRFDWGTVLGELGVIPSIGLALIAFVLGSAMDGISVAWHNLFRLHSKGLNDFKEEHNNWKIEFQEKDWAILRAYIYIHNLNVADEIERHNALSIMMRNISLAFALLSVCEVIQLITIGDWRFAVLAVILMFLSYQAAIQARNMRDWFYRSIYETIIGYGLKLEDIVTPVKSFTRRKKTG